MSRTVTIPPIPKHIDPAKIEASKAKAIAALGATALLLLVWVSVASAGTTHPFVSSFGPDGTSNTTFSNPQALAVHQSSGDVYVVDVGNREVGVDATDGSVVSIAPQS